MSSIFNLLDLYFEYLRSEKKASAMTIQNYTHYLHRFSNFLKKHFPTLVDPKIINSDVILQYKKYLTDFKDQKGKNLDTITQGYHLIALRSFCRYLAQRGLDIINLELIGVPHAKARQLKFLNEEQIGVLLRMPESRRDKSIMELLISTGLRVSDLVRLNKADLDFARKEINIQSKSSERRIAFLTEEAWYWLRKYLAERNDQEEALFTRTAGRKNGPYRLTARSIQRIVEKYVKKAGLPIRATPHTFRHTFALCLLSSGKDIKTVRQMLGHKNISTTQIYTHVTNPQLKEIHQRFHRK